MTAATTTVLQDAVAPYPCLGTYPAAANTVIFKGTGVAQNASGNAVAPTDGDGFNWVGLARATFDNSTGSEPGGLAGDLDVEVDYTLAGFAISGTTPRPGQIAYSVDNQTVSGDAVSATGLRRGIAGICTEVRTLGGLTQAVIFIGPHVAGAIAGAAGRLNIPISSFRISTGAAIPAFSAGVADGFELTGSEAFSYRINDDSTTVITTSVLLPDDVDASAGLVVKFLASRVGTTDDVAVITVGAFFQTVGLIHTGDANAGGATSAVAVDSVVNLVSRAIAAADVPAGPAALTLTITPDAALANDDMIIHAVWLEYTRK